jgi:hypothetical protein
MMERDHTDLRDAADNLLRAIDEARKQKYPNCEKLSEHHDRRHHILEFFEWLGEKGMFLAEWEGQSDRLTPKHSSIDHLFMQYMEIDEKELENERRSILEEQRKLVYNM